MNDSTSSLTGVARPLIMVVEDDLPVLQMACHILRGAGYEVISARSAEEGDEVAEAMKPAMLFSDVVLPGASGLELAARLTANDPKLQVLITTGQRTADVDTALRQSGHSLLPKPYTAMSLLDAVSAALDETTSDNDSQ